MEKLVCESCGVIDVPRVEPSGPHLKASCASCGSYIKFLRKDVNDFVLHFGKHKGKAISELVSQQDREYLNWALGARVFKKDWQKKIVENHLNTRL